MFINMNLIQKTLSNYKTTLVKTDNRHALSGYAPFTDFVFSLSENLLYIASEDDDFSKIPEELAIHLVICIQSKEIHQLHVPTPYVLYVYESDIIPVLSIMMDFFRERSAIGEFADSLLEILMNESGIQTMLDKLFPAFENPICVFDAGFSVIAANWEDMKKNEHCKHIAENRGFSEKDFSLLNKLEHVHGRIQKSGTPIEVFHEELGFPQLICSIDTSQNMGHIVISGINRDFNALHIRLMLILKKAIYEQMRKNDFIRNNRGFPHEYFLRDLLDGKIATPKQHLDHLSYVGKEFYGNMYCLVIETARTPGTINASHLRYTFETHFPSCKTLMYHGEIILLLQFPSGTLISESDLEAIKNICQEYGIYAGISNYFNNIIKIPYYHKQALRAIELGIGSQNQPTLFVYEQYYLNHIANIFEQKESSEIFCSSKLKLLMDYDKLHGTNLSEILYMYLIHERNLVATANAMKLHRNTINYHIKKISTIVSIDYDSYQERRYIILSYELVHLI